MTQSSAKASIAQNWFSFLDAQPTGSVFILDFHFISTTPGIDDLVKRLKGDNVTPVVISHWPATPDFGTLMTGEFQNPIDLPTFNLEPGSPITLGELVSRTFNREITGCAGDFVFETTLAQATARIGGVVLAYPHSYLRPDSKLPASTRFIAARTVSVPMQSQKPFAGIDPAILEAQQRLDHSQAL